MRKARARFTSTAATRSSARMRSTRANSKAPMSCSPIHAGPTAPRLRWPGRASTACRRCSMPTSRRWLPSTASCRWRAGWHSPSPAWRCGRGPRSRRRARRRARLGPELALVTLGPNGAQLDRRRPHGAACRGRRRCRRATPRAPATCSTPRSRWRWPKAAARAMRWPGLARRQRSSASVDEAPTVRRRVLNSNGGCWTEEPVDEAAG